MRIDTDPGWPACLCGPVVGEVDYDAQTPSMMFHIHVMNQDETITRQQVRVHTDLAHRLHHLGLRDNDEIIVYGRINAVDYHSPGDEANKRTRWYIEASRVGINATSSRLDA